MPGISIRVVFNRLFPSSLVPLFQSESKCETILTKMKLHRRTAHFHMKGFALRLVLKQRYMRTRNGLLSVVLGKTKT